MTDREALKAAMHPALHELDVRINGLEVGDCHCNLIAEVILDAILPVLDEGVTVEWAARCTRPNCACTRDGDGVFFIRTDQARTLAAIAEDGGSFELVSRRAATEWEAAS